MRSMFSRADKPGSKVVLPGITRKTLVYGDRTLLSEFRMQAGSRLPLHEHPHEQTGYLVAGRIRLSIGADIYEAKPGDSWSIAGGMQHGADILEDSVAVEVFSPVREDYLP